MIRYLGFLAALIVGAFLLTNTLSLAGEAVEERK